MQKGFERHYLSGFALSFLYSKKRFTRKQASTSQNSNEMEVNESNA